jgi:D-tyrosyl-tRNA(Tyr) deacylase
LAEPLYLRYIESMKTEGVPVETGVFQAMMDVELVNHGPVTVLLDPRPGRSGS